MTVFSRKFPIECLSDTALKKNEWFQHLLSLWHPAGNADKGPEGDAERVLARDAANRGEIEHLRVAFRGGYMNFYCGGQSVAKVQCVRDRLQAKIHEQYVYGLRESGSGVVPLTDTNG